MWQLPLATSPTLPRRETKQALAAISVVAVSLLILPLSQISISPPDVPVVHAPEVMSVNRNPVQNTTQHPQPHPSRNNPLPIPDLATSAVIPMTLEIGNFDLQFTSEIDTLKPSIEVTAFPTFDAAEIEDLGIFDIADLDFVPQLIHRPDFHFPAKLLRQGIDSGEITLDVKVDPRGRVTIIVVVDVSHPGLIEPAIQAVKKALFQSPMKEGRKVDMRYRWTLNLMHENENR
jgi:TonB family protein